MTTFRSPRWVSIFLAVGCIGCGLGAVFFYRAHGLAFETLGFSAIAGISLAGLAESLLTRVELHAGELVVVARFRRRVVPKAEIDSVTWEGGCGVSLKRKDGSWVRLPDVGNSQSRVNTIRAWLKR